MDEIESAIDGAIEAQVGDEAIDITFESGQDEPSGLMKVWEVGEHRAELRYLRAPDTNEPFKSPWHVKVIGPDPLAGGRVDSKWSSSYKERDSAEGAAVGKLRDKHRKTQRREENRPRQAIDAAIHRKCGCSKPRGNHKDKDKKKEWGATAGVDDPTPRQCDPVLMLDIEPASDRNVSLPENRLELEEGVARALGQREREVFSTIRQSPVDMGHVGVVSPLAVRTHVSAIDSLADDVTAWLYDEGWVDAKSDVRPMVWAGDREQLIRELEEGRR